MKPSPASCSTSGRRHLPPDAAKTARLTSKVMPKETALKLQGDWKADPGAAVRHIYSPSQSAHGSRKTRCFQKEQKWSRLHKWPFGVCSPRRSDLVPHTNELLQPRTLSSGSWCFSLFSRIETDLSMRRSSAEPITRPVWASEITGELWGSWMLQTQPCGRRLLPRLACARLVPCCLATATVKSGNRTFEDGSSKVSASLLL